MRRHHDLDSCVPLVSRNSVRAFSRRSVGAGFGGRQRWNSCPDHVGVKSAPAELSLDPWRSEQSVFLGVAMTNSISSGYSVKPITHAAVDRAYPLIRVVAPALGLHEWRQFCQDIASPLSDREHAGDREEAIVATNTRDYVKGLCIYSIREHWFYGRLLDVPVFVVASAADATGVGAELLQFLQTTRDNAGCSGVRFWAMGSGSWDRRLNKDDIHRTDHGTFMPVIESVARLEEALAMGILVGPVLNDLLSL